MPGYFEFDVTLRAIKPKIWRRFLIRDSAKFADLHEAIQDAGPWENCHLWEFREPGRNRGIIAGVTPEFDDPFLDMPVPDARKVKLSAYFAEKGDTCLYLYDFGDGWEHEVKLRKSVALPEKFRRRLIAGERAFPPEDCGGPWGYNACLALIGDPAGSDQELANMRPNEIEERREWLGDWSADFALEDARKDFDA